MSTAFSPAPPARTPPPVALVNLPFHRCLMPPIGLGVLKATLAAAGLPATVHNLNLDLLPEMGAGAAEALERYEWLGNNISVTLAGEWLFSPPDPGRDERYLALLSSSGHPAARIDLLRRLRPRVDGIVQRWARRVVATGADVVGFSTSYSRTRAAARLAAEIRRLAPGTRILLGGAGVAGDMGRALLEAFPDFDAVCHDEADDLIVPLVRALRGEAGHSLEALPSVSYREAGRLLGRAEGAPLPDVESASFPDYDDYFEAVRSLRASWDPDLDLPSYLPVETARGCWWGVKRHCAFCSMNGARLAFRCKSAERVLRELDQLEARYSGKRFFVVDNVMSPAYFTTLLPRLAEQRAGRLLYWELRPNLGREQVALLAKAGVVHVLPGIESLSTPALGLMNKGTTAIENVQTLKWLAAYEVQCSWNFLYSLPGERLEWYEEVARTIPRLTHLPPPKGPLRVTMQRFSPYFTRAADSGIRLEGPSPMARLAFEDVAPELLRRFAYGFDYEIEGRPLDLDGRILALLEPLLARWREQWEAAGCTLSVVHGPGESLLVEGPLLAPRRLLRLRGPMRRLLLECESIVPERLLAERLEAKEPGEAPSREPPLGPRAWRELAEALGPPGSRLEEEPEVTPAGAVAEADARGWVLRESGQILALPVDQTRHVRSGPFQLELAWRRFAGAGQDEPAPARPA